MSNFAPSQRLGLRAWAELIGPEKLRDTLAAANITPVYFNAMANYSKPCTVTMFEKIEAAALAVAGCAPDYEACTRKSIRLLAHRAKVLAKATNKVAEQRAIDELLARRHAPHA